VDSALASSGIREATAHYRAAYRTIVDDAPAIWLFEPITVAGVGKRLHVGTLRADGWWLGIPAWSVDAKR
jgi:hypothetical protein